MKKIKAFKAVRYNNQKIEDLSRVVTPPYDVIHQEMQEELYERHPQNFVRLDLAKEEGDGRYEAAQMAYKDWLNKEILIQDDVPAIYWHHQIFTLPNGQEITRKGFFACRRIEDFSEGGIKPHEKTLEGPKADRLKLTKALEANLSPVFSLYSDPEQTITQKVESSIDHNKPLYDFQALDGQRHKLWAIEDESINQVIDETLGPRPLFIADGHHRYETALNYRNERRAANPPSDGEEAFNSLMMYFSNLNDEGLVILPIHRALHDLKELSLDDLLNKLRTAFEVEAISSEDVEGMLEKLAQRGESSHAFVLLTKDSGKTYLVNLKRETWKNSDLAKSIPSSLQDLDVTVLHRLIFEDILGISQEDQANQKNIIYWKDTNRAIDETRKGTCDFTFLLNATRIQDVEKVAMAGEKMPQKSTFFYPKIISGLLINPLGE